MLNNQAQRRKVGKATNLSNQPAGKVRSKLTTHHEERAGNREWEVGRQGGEGEAIMSMVVQKVW